MSSKSILTMKFLSTASLLVILSFVSCNKSTSDKKDYSGWTAYAGSKEGIRYSSNDEITPGNVSQLQIAWTYSSNDKDPDNRSQNQCNPIMVDGIVFGTTPRLKLLALHAATGQTKWIFDPAAMDTAAKND